jgi:hypothetical protein
MKDNDWKNRWKSREMDQWTREDKRQIKKRNHKLNRRIVNDSLKNNDERQYDWEQLNGESR